MRIRTKIFALVGALSIVAAAISAVAVSTVDTYDHAVSEVKGAATRAFHSERLNHLVTAVVMESRGVYAARDNQHAKQFSQGILKLLDEIDSLLERWEPIVPAQDREAFANVKKDAASFRTFRTETARLGVEVSPAAANQQGNNEANRANRRAFQESIDALTKRSSAAVEAVDEQTKALYGQRLTLLIGLALGAVAAGLLVGGFVGHRQISRPLQQVTAAIQKLAAGDYRLPEVRETRDEVGEIWKSMQVFAAAMEEAEHLRTAQTEAEKAASASRKAEMMELASRFEGSVGGLVQHLSAAAQEMEATAQAMATTAAQTTEQSSAVASAADQTSSNVQAVAAATEELATSAGEIGHQVAQTSRVAAKAVESAHLTNARVQALAEGAQKIGDVVALINTIAGQTNLLALNATIEAARAGEAGRGFAVVASEVKELATQTSKATEEIATQIAQIQEATSAAVEAIRGIGTTIEEVHAVAVSVAAAAEQQQAAAQEIARNVSEAARGTGEVTENITLVQHAANDAGSAAGQVLAAAGELSRNSAALSREVDAFLEGVRAA